MAAKADSLDDLNHRLMHDRDELTETLGQLRLRARQELNPRRQIRRHLGVALAVCASIGLLIGVTVGGWFSR